MRRWVRNELKKNPAASFLLYIVNYAKNNRNNLMATIVGIIIIALFAGMIVKNRIQENLQAARMFAFAQNDFYRFNYKAAIKKFKNIEKSYKSAKILDHVSYLKGLSYYRQDDRDSAEQILNECLEKYPKSKIKNNIILSLASVLEEQGKIEQADMQYSLIEESSFLKPEALAGQARIAEYQQNKEKVIDLYKKLQSHYVNTYWGNFAKNRLASFGITPKTAEEYIPN